MKTTAKATAASGLVASTWPLGTANNQAPHLNPKQTFMTPPAPATSIIGQYGPWAASLPADPPALSFRLDRWQDVDAWRKEALSKTLEYLGVPDTGGVPAVTVERKYTYDGLEVEELSWQLPYGRPTKAVLLKPEGAEGPLPAVLGLHDHSGDKYFGLEKITHTGEQHPMMVALQKKIYSGRAWANELAKQGYVVLVPDAFAFGSRRVKYEDVEGLTWGDITTKGKTESNPTDEVAITDYNQWAGLHEHILSKSLFCGGTTWPGVFLAEDQRALDVLCARDEVDTERVGCCGLSGGGLRTAYLGGIDPRIACAVCVGFMTTWNDFLLNKAYTHTWMTYIPRLPEFLDFPEVLGMRAPRPTLVLSNSDDQLFTLPEMQRSDAILKEVFTKADATDRYRTSFYPGLHKFEADMQGEAFTWFKRWLS
uniref:Alpha/beta hydrolase family protein n=1 Tax=Roseihalotalea indica TaxID=2867963 RepID=A0AA49GS12_9BACT|nr:alpha/beta hydrolase family protein [Tunicatimonas sp. TK19036]